jgi:RNA polymerase sigma-70 factor (ECF subfamily)
MAEEVAQEALRRALEALRAGRVANLESLPAFVFETARNICLQRLRSGSRETRALQRLGNNSTSFDPQPLDQLISSEEAVAVRAALQMLSHDDREVLLLSYQEGLTAAEIGERLHLGAVAVRVRRHRALQRLAERLGVTRPGRREQI